MTRHDDPDDILGAWFDEGPRDLPSTTRRAIITSLSTNRQSRRGLFAPWRFPFDVLPSPRRTRRRGSRARGRRHGSLLSRAIGHRCPGSHYEPCRDRPGALADAGGPGSQQPADWPRYTSAQYGFTVGYPPDWTLRKAYRPWSMAEDLNDGHMSAGADGFLSGDEELYLNAWMVPLDAGHPAPSGSRRSVRPVATCRRAPSWWTGSRERSSRVRPRPSPTSSWTTRSTCSGSARRLRAAARRVPLDGAAP